MDVTWKIGFEVELLAPQGSDRRQLAQALAEEFSGKVESFFHEDAEPSKVPGQKLFYNLTPGFLVKDGSGNEVCRLVDDITLQANLKRATPPKEGWYRLLSDDPRLLRLVARHAKPSQSIEEALSGLAVLFGTKVCDSGTGVYRVADSHGLPVAMAAPLPGERERSCELVTAPLASGQAETLKTLFRVVNAHGFGVPVEGAVHIHYDGERLCDAPIFARLVRLLHPAIRGLRRLMRTNRRCRRLGVWSPKLVEAILAPEFVDASWEDAKRALMPCKPSKYRDYNLRNLLVSVPGKHTFEVRVLPVVLDVNFLLYAARLYEAVLWRACEEEDIAPFVGDAGLGEIAQQRQAVEHLLGMLELSDKERVYWGARLEGWEAEEEAHQARQHRLKPEKISS